MLFLRTLLIFVFVFSISGVKESYSEDKLFKYYSTWDDFKLCKNLMINGEWVYKKKYYNGKEISHHRFNDAQKIIFKVAKNRGLDHEKTFRKVFYNFI